MGLVKCIVDNNIDKFNFLLANPRKRNSPRRIKNGISLVYLATKYRRSEMVFLLIKHGADDVIEPFLYACTKGYDDIVKILLPYITPAMELKKGIVYACRHDNLEVVLILLRAGVIYPECIEESCEYSNQDIIQALIDFGVKPRIDTLNVAIVYNNIQVIKWSLSMGISPTDSSLLLTHSIDSLKLIFNHKLNINTSDSLGKTLLHNCSDIEVLKYLISHGANVNKQDDKGKTPLHYTVRLNEPKNIIDANIKELLISGADPNIKDKHGETPLFYVLESYYDYGVGNLLLSNSADPNVPNNVGESCIDIAAKRNRLMWLCNHNIKIKPDLAILFNYICINKDYRSFHEVLGYIDPSELDLIDAFNKILTHKNNKWIDDVLLHGINPFRVKKELLSNELTRYQIKLKIKLRIRQLHFLLRNVKFRYKAISNLIMSTLSSTYILYIGKFTRIEFYKYCAKEYIKSHTNQKCSLI